MDRIVSTFMWLLTASTCTFGTLVINPRNESTFTKALRKFSPCPFFLPFFFATFCPFKYLLANLENDDDILRPYSYHILVGRHLSGAVDLEM